MSALNVIDYAPPPILREFLKDYRKHELFYDWVVGPFGSGNPEPRFAIAAARIVKADVVGAGHVRLMLAGAGGKRLKAIAFRAADEEMGHALLSSQGAAFHLAGALRADTWQGTTSVQLVIDDAALAR